MNTEGDHEAWRREIEAWRQQLADSRADQDRRFNRQDRLQAALIVMLAVVAIANIVNSVLHVARIAACK
jgi:hypothetical protein